jgi:hypothetical protein
MALSIPSSVVIPTASARCLPYPRAFTQLLLIQIFAHCLTDNLFGLPVLGARCFLHLVQEIGTDERSWFSRHGNSHFVTQR